MAVRYQYKKNGFTLLEILVVIALLGLLTALIIMVLPNVANSANEAATRATITKITELVNKRLDAITRELSDQDERAGTGVPDYAQDPFDSGDFAAHDTILDTDNNNQIDPDKIGLAKVLGRKHFLRRHLPQAYSDLGPPPATPEASPFFYAYPNLTPGSSDPLEWTPSTGDPADPRPLDTTVTAELLYHILTHGEALGVEVLEESAFSATEIADTENEVDANGNGVADPEEDTNGNGVLDTNGDGLMELVDSWGNPIRFYRWPTRLIRPAADGSVTTHQTVDDTPPDSNFWKYALPINPGFVNLADFSSQVLISSIDLNPPDVVRGTGGQFEVDFQDETGNPDATPPRTGDPLANDPDDPQGRIHQEIVNAAGYAEVVEQDFHDPGTWHSPLIVSAGADGLLGLFEPVDRERHGHLAQPDFLDDNMQPILDILDNITNKQQ